MNGYDVIRMLYSTATAHAPHGGATVAGKHFAGGEFIPGRVMARATVAEKVRLKGAGPSEARPAPVPAKEKIRASVTTLSPARRVGAGKDAAVVLADGRPAPPHIKPSMVPPDWTDVAVSTDPDADVLVKARDKAGRIKTVYSDNFTMRTAAAKFARIHEMAAKAGEIDDENLRNRASHDPAVRDAADLTWLIREQATRPGSDGDTRARVKAYGATTLLAEHVVETPEGVRLKFIGKEGVAHDHMIRNPELAAMLVGRKRTAAARGGRLFATSAEKLNRYIGTLDGGMFTAKDFRTLRATQLAAEHVRAIGHCCASTKEYKAKVKEVAERVSHVLGNKPAQCLESYISPTVFSAWRGSDHG